MSSRSTLLPSTRTLEHAPGLLAPGPNLLFRRFAWATLAWILLVVVWGAYVRASGSGAGCGSHWPLCNGVVVPHAPAVATLIEFTHRLTSGVALLAVLALCFWAFRAFPPQHGVRRAALWSAGLLLAEALLGAGLVLFNYVDRDASAGRAVYLSLHLVNTQLLLAALALTAWLAGPHPSGPRSHLFAAALPLTVLVSITGVIAALGDTLFPAASLSAGLAADLSSSAHFLVRLRVFHPVLAVSTGLYILLASIWLRAVRTALLAVLQLAAGGLNLLLLAPVWLQLAHLLLADVLWIALVLVAAQTRRAASPCP